MADSLHDITIQATPQKVFAAWTTPEGQSSWWTKKCRMGKNSGDVNVFSFDNGNVEFHFRIEKQEQPHQLRWLGVKAEKMPDEWVGTVLEVEISPAGEGKTRMRFGHKNWKSTEGAFEMCNTTWGELMYRFKDYCEGKGRGPLFSG
jgi:uncharacterized protein YndB with AHSA1/START domain